MKMVEGGLKTVKCPQCNKVAELPEGGVVGLMTSLLARNLAEKHPEGMKQRKEHMQHQLKQKKDKTAELIIKAQESKQKIQQYVQREQEEVEKAVEIVMTHAQEIINQLKNPCALTQLDQRISTLETNLETIEKSQSNLEAMSYDDFHKQVEAMANKIERLKLYEDTEITGEENNLHVDKFIANVHLGRIVKLTKPTECLQEFGQFKGASAIASNPNGMVVVCDSSSNPKQVLVFTNTNLQCRKQCQFSVDCSDPKVLLDITISADDTFLVSKQDKEIDAYSTEGKYQRAVCVFDYRSKQSVRSTTGSITSTKDGRILTGSGIQGEGDDSCTWVVTVHETTGRLIKTIPISIVPACIADIRGTHVAVSDASEDKICVYDLQSGKETLNLDISTPRGISYDEQSDCMLVVRMAELDEDDNPVEGSGVIEQYCSITGKLVSCIAQGLHAPVGITMTDADTIAVADSTTVKLYKIH